MSSRLLKCVRYQAQFSDNIIFSRRRKLTNLTTLYQSDPVHDEMRNTLSTSRGEVEENKNECTSVMNLRRIKHRILWPRSVTKAELENILKKVISADDMCNTEALTLLKCCNKIFDCLPSKKLQFIEYLWSHLTVCNIPLGVDHYNERLKLYLRSGHDFSPMDILKEMKSKAISPNTTTYDQCIEYYCRKGNINCTSPLLTELSNQNISITENMYNSLIWGYYQNGEIEAALEMFDSRIENSIQRNKTYTIRMCISAEENKFHKIREVLKTCCLDNIDFCNKDILTVIYRLTVNNHTKHIDEVISYLRKISPLSSDEIHIILQLIYINRIDIIQKILLCFKDQYVSKLFIQNLVYYSTDVHTIIDMCDFLDNNGLCKNSLYWALYYSYFRNDDLCFPLLKIYKRDHKIKPHFFWPMLARKANMYDVKGILNIIKVMINDFNVSPCVHTLCNYILPYLFGGFVDTRKLLITCGINKTLIDNAFVVMYMRDVKTQNATFYVNKYPGPYFYNYIAPEVKNALIKSDDTESLIYVSSLLVDADPQNVNTVSSEEATGTMTSVPLDKLLMDIMDDGTVTKIRVKKIVTYLENQGIGIGSKTTGRIHQYMGSNMTHIKPTFKNMTRKRNNYKSSNFNVWTKDII